MGSGSWKALDGDRRWTEEDARRVLAAWDASGESLTAFARSGGLVPQRLSWWRKRLAGTSAIRTVPSSPKSPTGFLPVEVLLPANRGAGPALVIAGDGLRLEVEDVGLVPLAWIAELVVALRDGRS